MLSQERGVGVAWKKIGSSLVDDGFDAVESVVVDCGGLQGFCFFEMVSMEPEGLELRDGSGVGGFGRVFKGERRELREH